MESNIYLLTEQTLKASGFLKVNSVFLIEKGAFAEVEDIAFQLDTDFGHAPKFVAYAFVDVWKQTLVIRVVPCFLSWHNTVYGSSACGILVQLGDLEDKSI